MNIAYLYFSIYWLLEKLLILIQFLAGKYIYINESNNATEKNNVFLAVYLSNHCNLLI